MKRGNNYFTICLVIVSVIQAVIFIKNSINKEVLENSINDYTKEIKTFKNIKDELFEVEELEILEIENRDETWNAKVMITGDDISIKESLGFLNKYKIISYSIDGKNNKFNVTMDIIR